MVSSTGFRAHLLERSSWSYKAAAVVSNRGLEDLGDLIVLLDFSPLLFQANDCQDGAQEDGAHGPPKEDHRIFSLVCGKRKAQFAKHLNLENTVAKPVWCTILFSRESNKMVRAPRTA